jgi:hypothetical protein
MGTMVSPGIDVIGFLKGQHEDVKSLFIRVWESRGDDRRKNFAELRRLLAVHEAAEEEIVHPVARHLLPNGEEVIRRRLQEEREAKRTLAELDKLDADSAEFDTNFRTFETSVLAHAEAEELEELAQLESKLEPERLVRMRKAAEFAESIAPTRPHPGIESQAANFLLGPLIAMIDRAREAIAAKNKS